MTTLAVLVRPPHGTALRGRAQVWLEPLERRTGEPDRRPLEPGGRSGSFTGRVRAGAYRLRGRLPRSLTRLGWTVPTVRVRVRGARQRLVVHLGRRGWPSYPVGDAVVSFCPRQDLLALAFEFAPPPDGKLGELAAGLAPLGYQIAQIALEMPVQRGAREELDAVPVPPRPANNSVLFLRGDGSLQHAEEIERRVRAVLRRSRPRVGVLASPPSGGLVVLDRRYTVRFDAKLERDARVAALHRFLEGRGRALPPLAAGRVAERPRYLYDRFEFLRGNYPEHLAWLEELRQNENVVFAEPDLLIQLRATSAPDDPDLVASSLVPPTGQFTPELQGFPEAWTLLGARRSGDQSVTIAILDESFRVATKPAGGKMPHRDAPLGQVKAYHDFVQSQGSVEDRATDHGFKIWGVLGAAANNGRNIAGLAPACSFVLAERPDFYGSYYSAALLWLGGLADTAGLFSGLPSRFQQANPCPADVVCCAHELVPDVPAPGSFATVTALLAENGRAGNGCALVYAAGNKGAELDGQNAFAEDPNVIAVGDCTYSRYTPQVFRTGLSNFGTKLALCALGSQVWTLFATARSHPWSSDGLGLGGTSAASATVAGAVALLLADRPQASLDELRLALCRGAVPLGELNLLLAALGAANPALAIPPPPQALPAPSDSGHGLLHVQRALLALREALPAP